MQQESAVREPPNAAAQEALQQKAPLPPPADSQAVPSSSSSEVLPQQRLDSHYYSSSSPKAKSSSSAQSNANPVQLPSIVSATPTEPPAAPALRISDSSPQHSLTTPQTHTQAADSAFLHTSSSPASTASVSTSQLRLDSGRSAHSHQKGQPQVQAPAGISSRGQQPGPPQELLASLGSALRAQSRLRQKVTTSTTSPQGTGTSAVREAAGVSPSGQVWFDQVHLKSKGASGTGMCLRIDRLNVAETLQTVGCLHQYALVLHTRLMSCAAQMLRVHANVLAHNECRAGD